MLSFLKNFGTDKTDNKSFEKEINESFKNLKKLYKYDSITDDRKEYLKNLIENYGYLPYPYIKALEELTPAEILFGLEIKCAKNDVFDKEKNTFGFDNNKISPAQRAGFKNGDWIKKEQHNIKLINRAGLGNGNETKETGKLINWLRKVLILPA